MHYLKYKEIKRHGTVDFPVGYYYVTKSHPQYAMPYHWHAELELIHIIKGNFSITINETSRTAAPGDLFLINSGYLHGGTPTNCVYECLVFPVDLLFRQSKPQKFLAQLNDQELLLSEYYPDDKSCRIHQIADQLFALMQNSFLPGSCLQSAEDGIRMYCLGLLYQFMGILCEDGFFCQSDKSELSSHKNIYLLKNVLNYIETHYHEKIELNTLARIAGMSPKYFCHFFSEMTGHTPIDYVNFYRIERACSLLTNTDYSITEVALLCGFNDASYFTRTFKKYKFHSPRQYLKTLL